ncbi:MAG: GspE/PulE family protein [Patescibacteria group bacterium]
MNLTADTIKEILIKGGYVSPEDLNKAETVAKARHTTVLEYLFSQELLTKELWGQAIAESFDVPYADIEATPPPKEQVLKLPETLAQKFHAVLFKDDAKQCVVATDDPEQSPALKQALKEALPNKKCTIAFSLPEQIQGALVHYRKTLETRFVAILKEQQRVAPEIIDEIIEDALSLRASDIHFEPQAKEVLIRFRVDGVLHEAGRIPKNYYENILNRIKVLARLRIDEHQSSQDGAMRYATNEHTVDMRVSVVPTLDGEKIVIRLLSTYLQGFTLADLGLSEADQERLNRSSKKPFGMILVTGPTGSGKTTTLYALIKILNRPEVNITTIEDPVEYHIAGINQIQVNPQTNLTFAKGLRAIVRQDPNIILVGEIRDQETAEISINAALTGHLLFSTFHANDAATAIPRLMDMGAEPFLMASTLELVIAQRLARKICEACRYSASIKQSSIKALLPQSEHYFGKKETINLYRGKGCDACHGTGYRGRTAIFEFIENTPEMQDLILKRPSSKDIQDLARRQGTISLFEDGIEKVKAGITTLEELLRVSNPPRSLYDRKKAHG